ncbi:L-aspartate oxidase [bacterium]|jgi:L-aspartate oxidase|nr:L-aspartate oxidase [bacterium]
MAFPPRYLVSFHPKHTPHVFTDILVVGGGIAGLRAALSVPDDLRVLVVTKDKITQSNSSYAQGGIAGVLSPEDRFENHVEDTIVAGAGLCDRSIVEMVIREAPVQINDLVRMGTKFDQDQGNIALGKEGGHSHHRIVHALGDATGHEVMRAIIDQARASKNVEIWEKTFTLDLITHEGRCVGALVHRHRRGKLLVWAKQIIVASGGVGMVYRETTNPPVATGDGMAAAYRAGAKLRDMEFMQFHPTVLYVAGSSRFLISEAVRGEGAYLLDKNGHRFMPDEDSRAELAPRDVVAQAIVRTMEKTQHPNVYLDLSHIDPEKVMLRFPGIAKVCMNFGLDIRTDRIPVRPGAHYMIGGIEIDALGRTNIPGLWGAGEVTSSGLHGANRLASNSLLEGLVYGKLCAEGAVAEARKMSDKFEVPLIKLNFKPDNEGELDVRDITNSLRSLMVRHMGIVRNEEGLAEAEQTVSFWCRYALRREFQNREGWELANLLTVARLMIFSARQRKESRGTHFRLDFTQKDDANWLRHMVCPTTFAESKIPQG